MQEEELHKSPTVSMKEGDGVGTSWRPKLLEYTIAEN